MKLEQSFEVRAPVDEVWGALIDIERVAPCLPGAEITERDEDGTYRGDFKVKLGPTTAAYRGTLKMESLDEAAHVATMLANGQDKRGQGSAKATIVSRMTESGGVTQVEVETDFTITGKLARFGRGGMIKDISNRLLGDFARCLQAGFEGAEGDEAVVATNVPADSATTAPATAPGAGTAPPRGSYPAAPATAAGREPTDADADPATADASAGAGSQVPPTEVRATRGGAQGSARSPGERAAAAPSSEGPGGPEAPRLDTGAGAPDSPAAAEVRGVSSPAPSSPGPRTGGPRFSPQAASQPISGAGLIGSVLLDRVAPVLLPVVRTLRQLLDRLERALARTP